MNAVSIFNDQFAAIILIGGIEKNRGGSIRAYTDAGIRVGMEGAVDRLVGNILADKPGKAGLDVALELEAKTFLLDPAT